MHDHNTDGSGGAHTPAPFAPTQPSLLDAPPASGPQRLSVEFTGSGSEYFRIWLVNLLLSIVTLSLYRPFAKARRLAYFHGNTLVGGQPLGFHGNPWKMLRGYLLMLLFGGVYFVSGRFSPVAAGVALVCFALLWPALWRASLQFRLANTSWRGLRFGFSGDLGGAYRAMLPAVVPWLGFLAAGLLMPRPDADSAAPVAPPAGVMALVGLSFAAMLLVMPLSLAWIKRYQHGHYRYAGEQTQLDAGPGRFYVYALKLLGVALVMLVASGIFAALVMAGAFVDAAPGRGRAPGAVALVLLALGFYLPYFLLLLPYGQSRLQNLVWGHTRSQALQCHSALRLWPLGKLTLKNLVLVICTLGLYWPFAAIAMARLRLSAISVDLDGDLSQWQAGANGGQNDATGDATGDAAGDFFGIDMGL
ncbi:YjgN family protein [Ideonella sp.]|uniref:YjgN family protein n=1 Tax=Ideonella sp. TaxID=1929293 RepID=UPI0035AE9EB4